VGLVDQIGVEDGSLRTRQSVVTESLKETFKIPHVFLYLGHALNVWIKCNFDGHVVRYHNFLLGSTMRPMKRTDAPCVAEMDTLLFPNNCFNERTLSREIDLGRGGVEIIDGKMAGYYMTRNDSLYLDITRLGVMPAFRRQGVATRMLKEILEGLKIDAMLCVDQHNDAAIQLYRQHGFIVKAKTQNSWVMVRTTS